MFVEFALESVWWKLLGLCGMIKISYPDMFLFYMRNFVLRTEQYSFIYDYLSLLFKTREQLFKNVKMRSLKYFLKLND